MKNNKTIVISRTDSIGDVVLTLPMAGAIKASIPDCKIIFLGNDYTKSIIEASIFVDSFLNITELLDRNNGNEKLKQLEVTDFIHVFPNKKIATLAKNARIKNRIATTNRLYHWFTCNKLVKLSRKNSTLHEAQLNLKLLEPLKIKFNYSLTEIQELYGLKISSYVKNKFDSYLNNNKLNLILHPKSKGSAREWGQNNFETLIEVLDKEKYNVFISGTKEEKQFADEICRNHAQVINLCGTMSLNEFITFISKCDALVACSTGPLHIASALGKLAIGLYAPMKPIFPQRWAPVGINAHYLVIDKNCSDCRKGGECACILKIEAQQVFKILEKNLTLK